MKNCICTVDLDSTLANTDHRAHMINREGGTDWDAYSQACGGDTPVEGVAAMVRMLTQAGYEVHALSSRKASALTHTKDWFEKHDIPIEHVWLDESSLGDYTSPGDHADYKVARAREVEKATGKKIVLHLDDWARVAVAFEAAGIPCICVRTPMEIQDLVLGKTSSSLQ